MKTIDFVRCHDIKTDPIYCPFWLMSPIPHFILPFQTPSLKVFTMQSVQWIFFFTCISPLFEYLFLLGKSHITGIKWYECDVIQLTTLIWEHWNHSFNISNHNSTTGVTLLDVVPRKQTCMKLHFQDLSASIYRLTSCVRSFVWERRTHIHSGKSYTEKEEPKYLLV